MEERKKLSTRPCPYCGIEVERDRNICPNCGTDVPPGVSDYIPRQLDPIDYQSRQPIQSYNITDIASLGDRVSACGIDAIIINVGSLLLYIGFCYLPFKDCVNYGQSFGKMAKSLRVVDFQTGYPATISQSIVRNCLGYPLDCITCFIVMFNDVDSRRIGDHIAGTIVIHDM